MERVFTSNNLIPRIWIFCIILMMHFSAHGQTSHVVDVTNNVFTPKEITIGAGDTVIWTNSEGRHNVNGLQATFPSNPESFGNAVGRDWVFSHVFTIPGSYDYQCDPHASFGMTGTVIVEESSTDTLTINFIDMTPHVGQRGWLLVTDDDTGDEIERSVGTIEENFTLTVPGIVAGHSYTVEIFVDLNENGYYDAPPVDHAWRLEIVEAGANEVLDFTHNTDFKDIEWEHRAIINLSGMAPHGGQEIYFALVDGESGEVVDQESEIAEDSFTVELSELIPGRRYLIDFYADHNENGIYDAPPTDHAWRFEISNAAGDDTLNFIHNTEFTDVSSTFGPDIVLAEDPELGMILTDASGFTLYYFTKDALPETSLCLGGCVTNWPLFYVEEPELGEGLDMEDFSSIAHPEGGMQTTYKGWPLYYYVKDVNPGETSGEGVGNVWFVAKPDYSIMVMDGTLTGKDGVMYDGSYNPGEEVIQYFVDEYGMTLYIFINDTYDQNNFTSSDFGNDHIWPIYEEELQSVASTLDESLFGSIDVFGRQQLTYNGWPLYYYESDSVRGNTTGVSVPSPGVWPVAVQELDPPVASSAVSPVQNNGLQLFPNPVLDQLNIKADDGLRSIVVLTVTGSIVKSYPSLNTHAMTIDLTDVLPGIYLVEVRSANDAIKTNRIIVK